LVPSRHTCWSKQSAHTSPRPQPYTSNISHQPLSHHICRSIHPESPATTTPTPKSAPPTSTRTPQAPAAAIPGRSHLFKDLFAEFGDVVRRTVGDSAAIAPSVSAAGPSAATAAATHSQLSSYLSRGSQLGSHQALVDAVAAAAAAAAASSEAAGQLNLAAAAPILAAAMGGYMAAGRGGGAASSTAGGGSGGHMYQQQLHGSFHAQSNPGLLRDPAPLAIPGVPYIPSTSPAPNSSVGVAAAAVAAAAAAAARASSPARGNGSRGATPAAAPAALNRKDSSSGEGGGGRLMAVGAGTRLVLSPREQEVRSDGRQEGSGAGGGSGDGLNSSHAVHQPTAAAQRPLTHQQKLAAAAARPPEGQQAPNPASWDANQVAAWLTANGCPEIAAVLHANGVGGLALTGLLRVGLGAGGAGKLFDVFGEMGVGSAATRLEFVEQLMRLMNQPQQQQQ